MKLLFWSVAILLGLAILFSILDWSCEARQVAQEEFGPRELLRKYEWFKDASAQLDKKQADIKVYMVRLENISELYEGVKRTEWAKEDRQQHNLWLTEVSGVRASYNTLAADYNSQMSKINWRFTNAGQLPAGATEPLPRSYKPYEE